MYERSAIVLEKYIEKILRLNKTYNLKKNSENYTELISELENFQITTNKDLKVIQEFDETVKKIENIQREQEKLYKANRRLEDDRVQLFSELGEDYKVLDVKLKKIEDALDKNNEQIIKLREGFIQNLQDFSQKQKDRNKCDKERRVSEARIVKYREEINGEFNEIDVQDMINLKDFIASEKEQVRQEALEIMIKNGKSEKVPFNQDVLRKAANNRIDIAEKEAECYILIFDKMKKLLAEPDNESIKLEKYRKALRETSVKLAFLKAQKEYIFGFLDYERMTAISGAKAHKKVMDDACNNFELDMIQIKNLYELLLKEIGNKASQKSYKELYNKNYLKSIEDKEKNFEEEANNVNLKTGTIINSNYWRIEGIKNIYLVFQQEVSEKFEKDLSDYKLEGIDTYEDKYSDTEKDEYEDEYENEEEYEDEYDNEDEDEYENDDEYDDEEYEDEEDEYEDDDNEEYEDEEDDDDEYEDEDDDEYDDELEYEEDDDNEDDDEYEDEEYDDEDDEEYEDEDDDNEEDDDEYEDEDEEDDDDEYEDEDEEDDDDEYEDEDEDDDEVEEVEEIDSEDLDSIIKNSRKQALQKNTKSSKTSKSSKTAKATKAQKDTKNSKNNKETAKIAKTAKTAKTTKTATKAGKNAKTEKNTKTNTKATKGAKNAKTTKTTKTISNKTNNKDKGLFNKLFKK